MREGIYMEEESFYEELIEMLIEAEKQINNGEVSDINAALRELRDKL